MTFRPAFALLTADFNPELSLVYIHKREFAGGSVLGTFYGTAEDMKGLSEMEGKMDFDGNIGFKRTYSTRVAPAFQNPFEYKGKKTNHETFEGQWNLEPQPSRAGKFILEDYPSFVHSLQSCNSQIIREHLIEELKILQNEHERHLASSRHLLKLRA